MSADLETRAQDATERFLEDESLTEDLTDTQAKPLVTWLTQEAQAIALDAARSDEEVSAALKRLRSAVILSCKNIPDDLLADALIERVQHNLLPNTEPPPSPEKEAHLAPITPQRDREDSHPISGAQPAKAGFVPESPGIYPQGEEDNE